MLATGLDQYHRNIKDKIISSDQRVTKVIEDTADLVNKSDIVCLQEVCDNIYSGLNKTINHKKYSILREQYGNVWNNYMGICIVYDHDQLSVTDYRSFRPSDFIDFSKEINKLEKSRPKYTFIEHILYYIFKDYHKEENKLIDNKINICNTIKRRWNKVMLAKFTTNGEIDENNQDIWVCNIHMPCIYQQEYDEYINKYIDVVKSIIEETAGNDTVFFCGDFNFTPDSNKYKELLNKNNKKQEYYDYTRNINVSTRALTNMNDGLIFRDKLDYIFCNKVIENISTEALYDDAKQWCIPNENSGSDHLAIIASFHL